MLTQMKCWHKWNVPTNGMSSQMNCHRQWNAQNSAPNRMCPKMDVPTSGIFSQMKCPHKWNVPTNEMSPLMEYSNLHPKWNVPKNVMSPQMKCPHKLNVPTHEMSPQMKCPHKLWICYYRLVKKTLRPYLEMLRTFQCHISFVIWTTAYLFIFVYVPFIENIYRFIYMIAKVACL